jgi:hypothetical protein
VTSTAATSLLGPGTRLTSAIRIGLAIVALFVFVSTDAEIAATIPLGVDVGIPLAATQRWLDGGAVYLAEAFHDPASVGQPFLYPPFVLPLWAPLTVLPEVLVRIAWFGAALEMGALVCRRLAIPWTIVPLVLLWEPMFGAIWGANVQIFLFAAFVATFWLAARRHDLQPLPRDLDAAGSVTPLIGWYAATLASVKVTQLHAWLAILRRNWRAAILGALPWAILVLVTLPLVGFPIYVDWLEQLRRASDPTWPSMGPSLLRYLPAAVVLILTVVSLGLAMWIRGPDIGAWLGLLMLLVSPNMHDFNGLFLLPAMLRIRREFAILAALLTSSATAEGWWLGIAIVVGSMLAGLRWPTAYEPATAPATASAAA